MWWHQIGVKEQGHILAIAGVSTSVSPTGGRTLTHAVGLRTYQFFITRERELGFVDPRDEDLAIPLPQLLGDFVQHHASSSNLDEHEKTWAINQINGDQNGNTVGQITYGRYGYAATLKNIRTGEITHRRGRNESEELHLYYRIWLPDQEHFAIAAFESFSGKSCITLFADALREFFARKNPGFSLRVRRLMPAGASASVYAGRAVKNLTLVSRKPPNDIANQLFAGKAQSTKRMSVTVHSARNSSLGTFSDLISGLPQDSSGVIVYDGVEFDQAIAHVRIGRELKPVGVFGANSDVGVIDITESVTKDPDGLPVFGDVDREALKIMRSIYDTLHGQSK
jgi:hypothetical protein